MTGDALDRLLDGPAAALAAAVREGGFSPVDVAGRAIERCYAAQTAHRSFLHVSPGTAHRQAEAVERRLETGEGLPLAGVPLAVKDNIDVAGLPTTAGSRILEGYVAPRNSTVVARLLAAGCVVVGKTNMDEFGMGSSNENSAFGPVLNPWDTRRVPGGSSGGSAAAVAALAVPLAIGTDTGGSVRQPAALCGLVGVKPTWGRCSRLGLVAFASSLDQPGPLAKTVEDAAIAFAAMAGTDPSDATSLGTPVPDVLASLSRGARGVRVGLLEEARSEEGLHPEVSAALERAAALLAAAGAEVTAVSVPRAAHAVPLYYITATAEASSNLARFDGVRYGARRGEAGDLGSLYRATRSQGFGAEVRRRILLGTFALSSGYHDAYYGLAQRVRALLRRDYASAFRRVDAILCPTAPEPAFELGQKTSDPMGMYLSDVFTVPPSLAGIPAISIPSGFSSAGLPLGVQLAGPADSEPLLFALASVVEAGAGCTGIRPSGVAASLS